MVVVIVSRELAKRPYGLLDELAQHILPDLLYLFAGFVSAILIKLQHTRLIKLVLIANHLAVYSRTTTFNGRGGGTRTPDPRFWRPMLYQLSYTSTIN